MWFSIRLVLVLVFVLFAHSVCLDDIELGLGSRVASFLERAAHLVNHMFSFCLFVVLVVSHFVSMAGTWF